MSRLTREQKVEQMRVWAHKVGETTLMVGRAMKRNGVASIDDLSKKHPKQFNALYEAIEIMEEEMPEPEFPWPKV